MSVLTISNTSNIPRHFLDFAMYIYTEQKKKLSTFVITTIS